MCNKLAQFKTERINFWADQPTKFTQDHSLKANYQEINTHTHTHGERERESISTQMTMKQG